MSALPKQTTATITITGYNNLGFPYSNNQTINITGKNFTPNSEITNVDIDFIPFCNSLMTTCPEIQERVGSNWNWKDDSGSCIEPVGSMNTDAEGGFSFRFPLPINQQYGETHQLTIMDALGVSASAPLATQQPSITVDPMLSANGETVQISGKGFIASDPAYTSSRTVTIKYFPKRSYLEFATTVATFLPDENGTFEGTFMVPDNANDRPYLDKFIVYPIWSLERTNQHCGEILSTTPTIHPYLYQDLAGYQAPTPTPAPAPTPVYIYPPTPAPVYVYVYPPTPTPMPAYIATNDMRVETKIKEPLGGNLVRIFNFSNRTKTWSFYDPDPDLAGINTLQTVASGEVYWIKVYTAAAVTLNNKPKQLYSGWNLVAY